MNPYSEIRNSCNRSTQIVILKVITVLPVGYLAPMRAITIDLN